MAESAAAQGITVLEASGEAIIDPAFDPDSSTAPGTYRKAVNRFETLRNDTQGIAALATVLVDNSTDPKSFLEWCSGSLQGRVAAPINQTNSIELVGVLLGHKISFVAEFDLQDPEASANLIFEPLWEEATSILEHVSVSNTGTLGRGGDSCLPFEGVASPELVSPMEFELADVEQVKKEVGPIGSVKLNEDGT